jgi:transposase
MQCLSETFRDRPPFCPAYAHYTKTLSRFVYGVSRVMTLSDVADLTLLSWDTVKSIVKTHLARDYGKPVLQGVHFLGIDEIHLGKKKRFYTIVIDLEDGRIIWAKPGRGKAALRGFWRRLRQARAKIRAVAIDMSGAYWSAVLEHLPEAALVFDKFHVIKLMNERLDDLRREMVREAEGPLKLKIKGTRFLLLRNPTNLTDDQIPKLEEALHLNEPLLLSWYLKEELHELWNQNSRKEMKAFLKDWCDKAGQTGIGQMIKMAKTLRTHASGIVSYADHPITSGRLEGINNKIKTLTKRSYGFHDENFFVLKLLSLHHSKYKLLG